jgi:hypothetical protein
VKFLGWFAFFLSSGVARKLSDEFDFVARIHA